MRNTRLTYEPFRDHRVVPVTRAVIQEYNHQHQTRVAQHELVFVIETRLGWVGNPLYVNKVARALHDMNLLKEEGHYVLPRIIDE